jgi:acetyl esterase/lipase
MTRLVLVGILFLLSLLVLFRAPTNLLWYVSILITELCWVFFLLACVLLFWKFGPPRYHLFANVLALAALVIYLLPVIQAARLSGSIKKQFASVFNSQINTAVFRPLQMITGIGAKKVAYKAFVYDAINDLSLDFYPSVIGGKRPCVVVIHGGSWAAGDSRQLPELNSELAKEGYHVASINYRLAPAHHFPAPLQDVKAALNYLCAEAAPLSIDTTAFTLLGRSAGGQIALSAAYTLNDARVKGVVSFYGPSDMVWGYQNPTSPLVLNSRKVMEDYLGGSLAQVRQQYIQSSATETVQPNAPPALLLYGENDPLVSPRHGNRLTKKLDEKGVKYIAVYLPWATHAFDYTLNGPGGQLSTWAVKRFLAAVTNK